MWLDDEKLVRRLCYAALILYLCCCLTSCKTKVVTVPEYHTEYVTVHDSTVLKDTVMQYDSVYMTIQGDTVVVNKYRDRYVVRYKDKWHTKDSIRVDSVRVPYPVPQELSRWDKIYLSIGKCIPRIFVIILFFIIVYFVVIKVFR